MVDIGRIVSGGGTSVILLLLLLLFVGLVEVYLLLTFCCFLEAFKSFHSISFLKVIVFHILHILILIIINIIILIIIIPVPIPATIAAITLFR